MKAILAALPVVILAGAIVWERGLLARLRAERATLAAAAADLARLEQETTRLESLRAQLPEVDRLKEATRDLPALRNQARQLRGAVEELERIVTRCEQLKAEIQAPLPRSLAEMPGFVPKENWRRAGLATPQATVETLFWVMRDGTFDDLKSCATPEVQQGMSRDVQLAGPGQAAEMMQSLRKLAASLKGYRVAGLTEDGPDRVVVRVQVAAGREAMKLTLRRYGSEWRVENF